MTPEVSKPSGRGWSGTATLRQGVLEIEGGIGTAELHSHHSIQVMVAEQGEFLLEDGAGRQLGTRAVVIPPDQLHAIRIGVGQGRLVHVEPDSTLGAQLAGSVSDPASLESWDAAGAHLVRHPEWWQDGNPQAAPDGGTRRHQAVADAQAVLLDRLDSGPIRLAEVAAAIPISESRLAHLFSAELGLTFRAYVRWLRLRRAVVIVAAGNSLTDAAHGAGFSDSSHLTRVWRRAFGSAPTEFGQVRWVVDPTM
jgi:AraC-like DNA-binding protein